MPLKRSLSLALVTFYGLGSILGAGIYALIGEVTKSANHYTPIAFLTSSVVALFTAMSYAELCSRFPQSAGSALYVRKAFNKKWLSGLIGWLVVATGVVSAATISLGFVSYLNLLFPVSSTLAITILVLSLGGLAIWGIQESATSIMIMTIIEVGGLLLIVIYGAENFGKIFTQESNFIPDFKIETWSGIFVGAYIAFFAFIGFEDMVNIAEETKNPKKTLPHAILLAVLSATIIYLLVSTVLVLTLPYNVLTTSEVPLALIIKYQGHSPFLFGIIALISITNGILVQIIMASRLIYGMALQENAPRFFSKVNKVTKTPILSTLFSVIIILILAYWFPIAELAKATSTIILCVFSMIHLSLIKIKISDGKKEQGVRFPLIFPFIGLALAMALLATQLFI